MLSTGCNILSCRHRKREIWHEEEQVLLQEGGGWMSDLTLRGEVGKDLWNTRFHAAVAHTGFHHPVTDPYHSRVSSSIADHRADVGFPVARLGFVPRGSEGLANNLSSPVGRVDSTSTTGPVFRSDQSQADPDTLKGRRGGRVEERRAKGSKGRVLLHRSLSLSFPLFHSLSLSRCLFQAVNVALLLWVYIVILMRKAEIKKIAINGLPCYCALPLQMDKDKSNYFCTRAFLLNKTTCFFWLRGVVQQCSLLCRSNGKSMKSAELCVQVDCEIQSYAL